MNTSKALPVYIYLKPQTKPATNSELDTIKTERVASITMLANILKMIRLILAFNFIAVTVACYSQGTTTSTAIDQKKVKIVGLPCPNSSTKAGGPWTYEQAEKRKGEIYNIALTGKYNDWTNPTTGGAIHINKNDQIEVYQFTCGVFERLDSAGVHFHHAPKDTVVVVKSDAVWYNVMGFGEGNETSVLVTSEIDLRRSKVIKEVLSVLWKPGVQIYYLTSSE